MNRNDFDNLLKNELLLLDGATGTELVKQGMPGGVSPEAWVLEHPESIRNVQDAYRKAGSQIVYAPTFGGNRLKLEEFGLQDRTFEINRDLTRLAVEAAAGKSLVFGDIAPTGRFVKPCGDLPFDEAVRIYREQIRALVAGGADGLAIETMMDLQEARAALIAAREECDLPVIVSMTFEESGRTLTGVLPEAALVTLQALGASAFGCNCSTGPEAMLSIIEKIKPYSSIALLAKPNAGMPELTGEGRTIFPMKPEEFGLFAPRFAAAGVRLLGGCCGTTPEHIQSLKARVQGVSLPEIRSEIRGVVASPRKIRRIGVDQPFTLIGERINPTGKKALKAELAQGELNLVRQMALEQTSAGASVLDVNAGMPGIDEPQMLRRMITELCRTTATPLCIDSTSPEAVERALRLYPGRALFNSISLERVKIEQILPIAAKYGAMLLLLPLTDDGIPKTLKGRIEVIDQLLECTAQYGYAQEEVAIDALIMTVSADPNAARTALDVIGYCRERNLNTVCGLSNVSFGLPRREFVNLSFLGMAMGRGLNMAIANPSVAGIAECVMSCDVLRGIDGNAERYIKHFAAHPATADTAAAGPRPIEQRLANLILTGDINGAQSVIDAALAENWTPKRMVEECLIPAITEVGGRYERKEYFLPQLVAAAEAMQSAMSILTPLLGEKSDASGPAKKIILATVKGDIHDIGKNIVKVMLTNYGFEIIDLGKDVSAEKILEAVLREKVRLVGLSALMTTTMVEMPKVIALVREHVPSVQFMVGGAVVDESFAAGIEAEYASDAVSSVKIAQRVFA